MQLNTTSVKAEQYLIFLFILALLVLATSFRKGAAPWRVTAHSGRLTIYAPDATDAPIQLSQTESHLIISSPTERVSIAARPHQPIRLVGADLAIAALDVQSDLEIRARTLMLDEAAARTAGDLTLTANVLTLRDGPQRPLQLQSGGALTLQGTALLDISALSHPSSMLVSGGALRLVSDHPVRGDAHYAAGGPFEIAQTDGRPNALLSPNDPVILANGDVSLGSYSGASLHILAGGSISLADVTITGPDSGANTINPGNSATFNGRDTFADLAKVSLSNGQTLTINGRNRATLDVRAGVDWSTFAAAPGNQVIGAATPTFSALSDASINISGAISVAQPDGLVLLTNQYRPNPALGGGITTGDIDVGTTQQNRSGGDIAIDSKAAIGSGALHAGALVSGSGVTAGDGGSITALAAKGAITTGGSVTTYSQVPVNQSGSVGDGGDVFFVASSGITIGGGNGDVLANAFSNNDGAAGSGGNVTLITTQGDIAARTVRSDTFSLEDSSTGNGGDVLLRADAGSILLNAAVFGAVRTASLNFGAAGNAGSVTMSAAGDISTSGQSILANVSGPGGNGGTISVTSLNGRLLLGELSASAVSSEAPGRGGSILLQAGGDIETADILTFSNALFINHPSQDGGAITIESGGSIAAGAVQSTSTARGQLGDTGNGGDITLTASQSIATSGAVQSYALASVNNSFSGAAGSGGSIRLTAPDGISVAGAVEAYSRSTGEEGSASSGGAIEMTASSGAINTNGDIASDASATGFPSFDVENGGNIFLAAATGIDSGAGEVNSQAYSIEGTVGNGGDVTATTSSGDIRFERIQSGAVNTFADFSSGTGSAGSVRLQTGSGRIEINGNTNPFFSGIDATSSGPEAVGNGGDVTLSATQGIVISGRLNVRALGEAGNGGSVSLTTSAGNIVTNDIFADGMDNNSTPGSAGSILLRTGNGSIETGDVTARSLALLIHNAVLDGGDITIEATGGSVSTGQIASYVEARGRRGHTGDAGRIRVMSEGDFITTGPVQAYALAAINNNNSGRAGLAGSITLQASGTISVTGGVEAYSAAPGPNGTAKDAGDVTLHSDGPLLLGYVDARSRSATGTIGRGGVVQLRSATSARLFGSPFDIADSISAVGQPNSSAITVTHGNTAVPFTIGDPSANGSSGGIDSGDALLAPTQSLPAFHFEPPNIWVLDSDLTNIAVQKRAVPASAEPGEKVQFVLTYRNTSGGLAQSVHITNTLPVELVNPTFASSPPLTALPGAPFVWEVGDLPAGASGTITVTAQLAAPVPAGTTVGSSATIGSTSYELAFDDNSASAALQVLNAPPDAVDDRAQTDLETAVTLLVLQNDSDRNGDALTLANVGTAANGTVTDDGTAVTYTPDPGFAGDDSFVYTVSDGVTTSEASVLITVREGNAPIAYSSTIFLPQVVRSSAPTPQEAAVSTSVSAASQHDTPTPAQEPESAPQKSAGAAQGKFLGSAPPGRWRPIHPAR